MPRRSYSAEFRARCLSLVTEQLVLASSREDAIVTVATSMQIPVTTLRNWVRAVRGSARTQHLPADAELALRDLEKEIAVLRRAAGIADGTAYDSTQVIRP